MDLRKVAVGLEEDLSFEVTGELGSGLFVAEHVRAEGRARAGTFERLGEGAQLGVGVQAERQRSGLPRAEGK